MGMETELGGFDCNPAQVSKIHETKQI